METHQYTNRLIEETSPYLLQHAHNPVDWYPWGQEAINKAKTEDKPIFLSIGYSACHWCHVMAHECFEDEVMAQKMNELFVNIKVDREERPDLDSIYMKSVIALVGQGGWPISLFLTPDQKPFFGGTYFPPHPKYNRPGFPQILDQAHALYRERKDDLEGRIGKIMEKLTLRERRGTPMEVPVAKLLDTAVQSMSQKYDSDYGGFGSGMKFPEPMVYTALMRQWLRSGSTESLEMLDKSLTRMAEGGIFDQLGGGFHRYSTDRFWLVPHFEKMLYDNALLAKLYLDMFQATKQEVYGSIPRDIFSFIRREMTSPEGGFYSSQDADTEGEEGKFYVWQLKEVLQLLGPRHAKVLARAFDITSNGNWAGSNVLHIKDSMETISKEENIAIFEVQHILSKGKEALFEARKKRVSPGTDRKILTGWNGLMITALATGYQVLHGRSYLDDAKRCAEFLFSTMWTSRGLLRVYTDGHAKYDGVLEDYAYLLEGLVTLYEASLDILWIRRAAEVAQKMIDDFWDEEDGGFFMTGKSHEQLVARLKNAADEAVPSPNAVAALSLLRLGHLCGNREFISKGENTVRAFQARMEQNPGAFQGMLAAADFMAQPPLEIVFAGPREKEGFDDILGALHQDYRPNKIIIWNEDETAREVLPLAEGKIPVDGEPTVYVCQNQACHPPVQSGKALLNILEPPPEIRLNLFDYEKKVKEVEKQEQNNFFNAMDQIFKFSGLKKQ